MKTGKERLFIVFFVAIAILISGCGGKTAQDPAPAPAVVEPAPAVVEPAPAPAPESSVRIGTSSTGSTFYVLTVGLSELINKYTLNINATAEPVGGSDANVFALEANKIDLAMLNSSSAYNGYYGEGNFKKPVDVKLVAQGQASYRNIIVRKDSGIESVQDLAGKKIIAKRPALPEIEQIMLALLQVYQVPADKVKIISTVETDEALEALKLGSVDGVIVPAGLKSPNLAELFNEGKVKLLQIDDDKLDELRRILPKDFILDKIPAGTYAGQDQNINAIKFTTYLIAKGELPELVVYHITKTLFDYHDEFKTIHSTGKEWTVANSLRDPAIPFHPGAIGYYKEIGKWDSKLEQIK